MLLKLSRASSVVLATTFLLTGYSPVEAVPISESNPSESSGTEIERTDKSFQALQQLAAKYDCLPKDSVIFTGKRDYVTRAVFTTNLNTCVQSIEELVARRRRKPTVKRRRVLTPAPAPEEVAPAPTPEFAPPAPVQQAPEPVAPTVSAEPVEPEVSQQDLDTVKALISSFESDLYALEARIKKGSFSTTTKLVGEGIFSFSGYGGVPATATRLADNTIFSNRLRLNFDTSFTGKDRLRSRLQSRNITSFNTAVTGTNQTRLGYDGFEDENTFLSLFQYDFPLGDTTKIRIAPIGYEFNDNQPTLNPQLSSSANGAISRFGRFNPIFRLSGDGAAVTLSQKFSDELSLDLGYSVPGAALSGSTAATVAPNNGFFKGQNAILSQLTYSPSKELSLAALYGRSYNNAGNILGGTGTAAANNPFGAPTTANHYSFLATYKISPSAVVSGWAGFVDASPTSGTGSASISNYALTLAFPDFGAEGNVLGFVFGVPPRLNSRTTTLATAPANGADTSYHIEAIYKIRLNENMDITPGLLLITSPENNATAFPQTEYVGTLRTTFRF